MFPSAVLRHGVCIFTLIGLLNGSITSTALAGGFAQRPETDAEKRQEMNLKDPLSGLKTPLGEKVAAFRLTKNLKVATSRDGFKFIYLQAGDVIDAAFDVPPTPPKANVRQHLDVETFFKSLQMQWHKEDLLEMKVKDSSDQALENTIIYLPPSDLNGVQLVYSPDPHPLFPTTVSQNDNDNDAADAPVTLEAPDLLPDSVLKDIIPEPSIQAHPRRNLPLMKPGMANLPETINVAFADYSSSRQVIRLVNAAYSHVYTINQHGRRSLTYVAYERRRYGRRYRTIRITRCWRAVKDALISSGLVDRNFGASSPDAFMARENLLNQGFRDLLSDARTAAVMRNPNLAPKGAILVYEDVVRGRIVRNDANPGHVEIKTGVAGAGGYISITPNAEAAYGFYASGTRRLIAVMVRDT